MSAKFHPIRSFGKICAAAFVLFQFTTDINARIERMTIREAFNSSDAVIIAQIDDQKELREGNERCGVQYTATASESLKGDILAHAREVTFGRNPGLLPYRTYLLFLVHETDPKSIYERLKESFGFDDPRENIIELIKCKGIIPGFVYRNAWEIISDEVRIIGVLPEDLPKDIHIFSAQTADWYIRKNDVLSYLRTLRNPGN